MRDVRSRARRRVDDIVPRIWPNQIDIGKGDWFRTTDILVDEGR